MDAVLLKPVRREDLRAMLERYAGPSGVAPLPAQRAE